MKKKIKILNIPIIIASVLLVLVINCKKKDPNDVTITWANPADIIVGTPLSATQLNASADVPGTFIYTPAIGSRLAVGSNQELKVDFTPTDVVNYNSATKTVTINVNAKIDPIIIWAEPAEIKFGVLLSETQLNATSEIDGIFVYTPAIGTKLNEGLNQVLKVDFTPTDTITFNSASKSVKINVIPVISNPIFNPNKTYGTMTDQDGNVYKTITIGTQTWMAENLRTTKYRDGSAIPEVTGDENWGNLLTGAYCNYNNTKDNDTIAAYGRFYNWYAVANSNNLAPSGWHIPSEEEWLILSKFLGGELLAGGKLKEVGLTHWYSPNEAATNATGFTAIPCGNRDPINGIFAWKGYMCAWWSSSESYNDGAWSPCVDSNFSSLTIGSSYKTWGISIRCIKD